MFGLIFIIFHWGFKLLLWQRKATHVLVAAVLFPQSSNWWLQCLSSFLFNDETRECSSPCFLLIILAALPAEPWTGHFPPVATGAAGRTIRSQEGWLRYYPEHEDCIKQRSCKKSSLTEATHNSPSCWQVLGWEEREYRAFPPALQQSVEVGYV